MFGLLNDKLQDCVGVAFVKLQGCVWIVQYLVYVGVAIVAICLVCVKSCSMSRLKLVSGFHILSQDYVGVALPSQWICRVALLSQHMA